MSARLRAVYVGSGKVHLTTRAPEDRYAGSLCGRMAGGRGRSFFVKFTEENGCKHCAGEARRQGLELPV